MGNPFEQPGRAAARQAAEREDRKDTREQRAAAAERDKEFEAAGGELPEGGRMLDADQRLGDVTENIGMSQEQAEKSFGLDEPDADQAAA